MNNKEKIENLVNEIIKIERESMKKRFEVTNGTNEKFSTAKADMEVVNSILSLLGEGKKGGKK